VTLVTYRCLPEGGHSRPRPPTPAGGFTLDAVAALTASGPLAAVDAYGRPADRPRWLAGEYLALLERQGRGGGIIYPIHFDRPIGDLRNPRGFASHYTGWTLDLPSRLVLHAQGRGARLMQVVGEQGIGWQLARIWTGTRTRERSLKQRGATRRCPVCQLAALGLQPPRPVDPLAVELGVRVAGSAAPVPPLEVPPAVAA
jgi:predicted GIY-YIG superfamily endonuclease